MSVQEKEIYAVIVIGGIMAFVLIAFILVILFIYQRRQHKHEKELVVMEEEYERVLLQSQLEVQEQTFKQISQELHDNIAQILNLASSSINQINLDNNHPKLGVLENAKINLKRAILDIGNLNKSLHTDRITQIGIIQALEFEVNNIRNSKLIDNINISIDGKPNGLDEQKSIIVFRMFQEMVNNALKHSKATTISVGINFIDNVKFQLSIIDDGVGFSVEEKIGKNNSSGGVGLRSMKNRAALIGGEFKIISQKGEGTQVYISIPLLN